MDDFFGNRYKKFIILPIVLLVVFLTLSFVFPGVTPGIDITGGNVIVIRSQQELDENEITRILYEEYNLPEMYVSTISSPTGYGAWIEYGKDPIIVEAEDLISQAIASVDDEEASMGFSRQAIVLLGGDEREFPNANAAISEAQDFLSAYKEEWSKGVRLLLTEKLGLGEQAEFQMREISPTIGSAALSSMITISLIGFILISIIIFIAFRQFVPTVAIIFSMIFDVSAGLAGMALLGIPLSITTIPALLMLIGYSVDTDIMLTSRILKGRTGTRGERATTSMKTGLTMTFTTLAALTVMLVISYFYQIEVIYYISAILFSGLLGDIVSTWFMNAPLLLWFTEGRK